MADIVPSDSDHGRAPVRGRVVAVAVIGVVLGVAVGAFALTRNDDPGERASTRIVDRAAAETAAPFRTRDQVSTTTTSTTPLPVSRAVTSAPADGLAAAVRAAEQFVAAALARDCNAVLDLMSANTLAWLDTEAHDGRSGRDDLCEGLATEEIPPMKVLEPARAVPGGAIVDLESDGDVEPLMLVLESGSWKVDLLGTGQAATTEYAGSSKQSDLRNGLTAEKVFYTDEQRYTDDLESLEAIEPSLEWAAGVADDGADRALVYVAVADGAQVVCLSAIDYAGVRYMIKDSPADGVTYAKGDRTPRQCDAAPLDSSW